MKIPEILQIPEAAYEYYLWQTWLGWAERHAKTETALQAILANTALYSWWIREYRILEAEFITKATPYIGKVSPDELFTLYDKETERIAAYYSRTLIQKARKLKVITNHPQLN